MSDYPFKAPAANPFSAAKKEKESEVDPANRLGKVLAEEPESRVPEAGKSPVTDEAPETDTPAPAEEPAPVVAPAVAPAPVVIAPSTIEKPKEPLPQLTMEEKSCRSCEYYAFDESMIRSEAYKGECRRQAPSPGQAAGALWPEVPWNTWCGEWENGVSNEDMVRMARDIGESIASEEF